MWRKHNPILTPNARSLRKSMTAQECLLWYGYLRAYPVRILRQKVIDRFVVDFYCAQAKLVIEIDGGQHQTSQGMAHDHERTLCLQGYGLHVLRFSNDSVSARFTDVCEEIDQVIRKRIM